jgi:ribosomal protein S18 acetylase RimI-like enzyme
MCFEEDINLTTSVVAMRGKHPLGIALFAQRELQGWISAVGVVPMWRRRGIARQMLRHIQVQAQKAHVTSLTLEVLVQNHKAVTLYESLGFIWQRDLFILSGESARENSVAGALAGSPTSLSKHVRRTNPTELLQFYPAFHEIRAPWQRDLPTLYHRAKAFKGLGIWERHQLIGYLLYQPQPQHDVVYDLAVHPSHPDRLPIAKALLAAHHNRRPNRGGYVINLPAEDPLLPAFIHTSYHVWQQQYEMTWRSNDAPG